MSGAGVPWLDVDFPLRGGRGSVVLEPRGIRHPRSARFGGQLLTPYADVTHVQLGARTLRLATRRSVYWVPRAWFEDPAAPENLVRALLERIVSGPEGTVQLSRMTEIEELARSPARLRACTAVALLCVAVAGLDALRSPLPFVAGLFSTTLALHGEVWRLVTANFLHAFFPVHLGMNVIGLLVLGVLVERPLGSARTLFVLGLSALGATGASLGVGYENLVGASGMVAGLAGAALWLELRLPERLPAFWRIPRRPFVALLIADALLPLWVPLIAGAAHLGGFAGGLVATALCSGPRLRREPVGLGLRLGDALVVGVAAIAFASAAPLALGDPAAWRRHGERLASIPDVPPVYLNDTAWLMATEMTLSSGDWELVLGLAERAVDATAGRDPNVLDTLAEVQFRTGHAEAALGTIERAIALAPEEPYFREQRRRFLGERAFDDLPPPPGGGSSPVRPPPATPVDPGVSV